jgi:hypothetical protein
MHMYIYIYDAEDYHDISDLQVIDGYIDIYVYTAMLFDVFVYLYVYLWICMYIYMRCRHWFTGDWYICKCGCVCNYVIWCIYVPICIFMNMYLRICIWDVVTDLPVIGVYINVDMYMWRYLLMYLFTYL